MKTKTIDIKNQRVIYIYILCNKYFSINLIYRLCIFQAPSWAYFLCAMGVFLYQTLDALDGKQAIKVQDTQIEEVYDHGCDAVSTGNLKLNVCSNFFNTV